ncbi:Pentatricopeptide repeat [Dillenia turbinata]|uniref:glutathione transferase n=1 Tax=Dillenia turbinata TaxID=194707 RepID=A0AAN8UWM9_9MAGN
MNRSVIISSSIRSSNFISHKIKLDFSPNHSLFCIFPSFFSTDHRPFPDYSPKKPTIRDTELVNRITTVIKQRRSESLRKVLKSYESSFKTDHFIWVLMNIKNDYRLCLDFFDWACLRREPNLESRCIVIQLAVASKDAKMAHELMRDSWEKSSFDACHSFKHFFERLIYTYKDWGSNSMVFDIFFQVLVEIGMLSEARKVIDKMLNYGLVISVDSRNLYLSHLSNDVDGLKCALGVFVEFLKLGVHWNTMSHNIVIHVLCRLGKVREAHSLMVMMEIRGCMPDVVSYSTIIDGYCHGNELQIVMRLIEEMQIKGLKPNPFTYNSIILLLCKSEKLVDAERVLREMMSQRIVPDNVVYTTLINGFCKIGNFAAACRLFDEMQRLRIAPDLVTCTAIVCGLCQIGKISDADDLFKEMQSKGLIPDEVTYTALIDGYCKVGKMKEAFSLHNRMVEIGLTPNVVTYTTLADGLCKQGELETANELLHEICRKGIELNLCTYNSLLNGLCKAGNIAQAVKLMEDMEVGEFNPDTVTYTTLMDAYCKLGEMDKAYELLRRMLDKGLQPTIVTFNVLMNGFCLSGMLDEGEKLLCWMLEKGIMPNVTTYNSLMKQYCIRNNMRSTTDIYKGMCARGVMPDENTYNILIRGHSRARNMKEAWYLHKEMVGRGFKLTVGSYNALIKGFVKKKKFAEAMELFEEMRREGLVADKELYSIFADIRYDEGNLDMTLELCDEVIETCLMTFEMPTSPSVGTLLMAYFMRDKLYIQSNPVHKKVPVLIHGDKPVCESLVIVEYIDEVWSSGPSILPSDPYDRATARFWAAYVDEKWFKSFTGTARVEGEEKAALLEQVREGLALLEEAFPKSSKGKDFFGGDQLGYLDLALGCHLAWVRVSETVNGIKLIHEATTPHLAKWAEKFCAHSAVKDVMPQTEKLLEFYKEISTKIKAAASTQN